MGCQIWKLPWMIVQRSILCCLEELLLPTLMIVRLVKANMHVLFSVKLSIVFSIVLSLENYVFDLIWETDKELLLVLTGDLLI